MDVRPQAGALNAAVDGVLSPYRGQGEDVPERLAQVVPDAVVTPLASGLEARALEGV